MSVSVIFKMQKIFKKVTRFQKIRKKKISLISAANFIQEMSKCFSHIPHMSVFLN